MKNHLPKRAVILSEVEGSRRATLKLSQRKVAQASSLWDQQASRLHNFDTQDVCRPHSRDGCATKNPPASLERTDVEKQNIESRLTSAPFSFSASLFVNLFFWRSLARLIFLAPQLHHCPALSLPVLQQCHRLFQFFRGPKRSLFPPESSAHA